MLSYPKRPGMGETCTCEQLDKPGTASEVNLMIT